MKRITKRIWIPALAAAVLLAGGVTAAVAAGRGKIVIENSRPAQESSGQNQTDSSNAELPADFEPEKPDNTLGLNLTDQQDDPAARLVQGNWCAGTPVSAPGGYYHWIYQPESPDKTDTVYHPILAYTDAGSGETVPLCAKPECAHDGNDYCPASTRQYSRYGTYDRLLFYDGYLYRLAWKEVKSERELDIGHIVLLRYEPDGTGITELHDFGTGTGGKVILHRGYLWCLCESAYVMEVADGKMKANYGVGLYGYELATGKITVIVEIKPDMDAEWNVSIPYDLFGGGDFLYLVNADYIGSDLLRGVTRINLLSGKRDTIAGNAFAMSCMSDGKDLIWSVDQGRTDSLHVIHHMNLLTGEEETLPSYTVGNTGTPNYIIDGIERFRAFENFDARLYDGHLFAAVKVGDKFALKIYGMDGKLEKTVMLGSEPADFPLILNGRLYLHRGESAAVRGDVGEPYWESCSVSELLESDGTPEFQKAYDVDLHWGT